MLTGARFFHQPNYEPDVLNFAEDIKMPFGVAELFTFPPAQVLMASSRFSGPVLVSQHITICFIPEMLTSKTFCRCLTQNSISARVADIAQDSNQAPKRSSQAPKS